MKILVIIPAYNEEKNIIGVVENLQQKCSNVDYIIINDCSKDSTEKIIKDNGFNYISLPVNLGIGGGVQTGYRYAVENNYDIAIQIDGDGQHDPIYIEKLIEPIINGEADMVIGSRFIEKEGFQTSFMRRLGINFLKGLIKLCCRQEITDTTSGFRATSKDLTKRFADVYAQDYPEPEAIIDSVLNGYRVKEVPVIMHERKEGESSINTSTSVYYMIKVSLAIILCRLSNRRKFSR
ncbi:glycosyltransferase family 2 protein [Clostridium vincentii]|uniref:Undecaprenyl-phosphate mannosyltransferase n=1 Tax=Clostridium vincentii TaxID=52704 RepID=A0A2T0BGQ3_9CLOT|nr:glycosyltransferase family 2 protein [Clostridium vincentii]PRR83049.1 Undecaprenyl-phosphate mannosyltransferase [Clostridium vincentii]